jgi:hypothetical protein
MSVPRHLALKDLLLPRMAVYASPENLSLYKDITIPEDSIQYSSEIIRKVRLGGQPCKTDQVGAGNNLNKIRSPLALFFL